MPWSALLILVSWANGKESADSKPVDFTVKFPVPINYYITIKKNWDTVLKWDAIKGADGYNVYYYIGDPSNKKLINTQPITKDTYTIPESAWPNWKTKFYYYVAVTAIFGKKESAFSQPVQLIWIPDNNSGDSGQKTDNSKTASNNSSNSGQTTSEKTNNTGSSTPSGTSGQTTSGTVNSQDSSSGQTTSADQSSVTSSGTSDSGMDITPNVKKSTVTIPSGTFQDLQKRKVVNVNLSTDQNDLTNVVFSPDQMDKLISQNSFISIERDTSTVILPTSIFNTSKAKTTVSVEKLDPVSGSVGDVYDFTIHQGSNVISHFDHPVTLSFKVDPSKVTDPQSLKVYYWNTNSKKWELIGGKYKNGVVTAKTIHFSTYGVFEKQTVKKAAAPNLKKSASETAANKLPKSTSKKNEGSSGIWIALITLLVIACGFSAFILARRKKA